MTPEHILAILTHGGPAAITGLLWYLYVRERKERVEAQALVLTMTKELASSTAQMTRVTEENTRATTALADHIRVVIVEKLDNLVRRRQ